MNVMGVKIGGRWQKVTVLDERNAMAQVAVQGGSPMRICVPKQSLVSVEVMDRITKGAMDNGNRSVS